MIAAKSAGAMDEEALKAAKEEAGASDDDAPKSKTKMWISGLILIGVVLCMALDLKTVPLHTAAVTGAILCVVTGCLKEKEAYAGIDWVTIFLFAGMLSVASAMEKTGAGKLIADTVVSMMGTNPNPYVLTAVLFLISNVLTQFMSNTASAALLAPIGISIAQSIGADPKPVLMALASLHPAHSLPRCYSAKHPRSRTWRILLQRLCKGRRSDVRDLPHRLPRSHPDRLAIRHVRSIKSSGSRRGFFVLGGLVTSG